MNAQQGRAKAMGNDQSDLGGLPPAYTPPVRAWDEDDYERVRRLLDEWSQILDEDERDLPPPAEDPGSDPGAERRT